MAVLNSLKLASDMMTGKALQDKKGYIIELDDGEKQIFIWSSGFLTTRYPSKKFPKMELQTLPEKELFQKDCDCVETFYPELACTISHMDVNLFPKDPLVLFIVKKDDIPDRYLVAGTSWTKISFILTNLAKLKSFFEEKGNAYLSDQLYLLSPFQIIKSKYLSIDWDESEDELVLFFEDLSKDNLSERQELNSFLSNFRRYLKFTCDVDVVGIYEFTC